MGHLCDVVKLGNPLKTALIHFLSSVLMSSEFATQHVKLKSLPSLARKQKKTLLARCRSSQRAWRNQKPVLTLSALIDEESHRLENEDESGRRLCEYWGTKHMKRFCDLFSKLLMTSFGQLIGLNLMTSLLQRKTRFLDLTEFPYGVYRCAGGPGSKFLFNAYQAVLEGKEYS